MISNVTVIVVVVFYFGTESWPKGGKKMNEICSLSDEKLL